MSTPQQSPTLYDDWLARRDRLASLSSSEGDRRRSELRLLEFLLEHYRGSAVATRPARFPARTEVYVDRRAIVVHNHLGKGYLSDVHTHQQAERHVHAVLERMAVPESGPGAGRPLFDPSAPRSHDEKLDGIRGRLCEGNADMRLLSIVELGQLGTLDDIGLISDLFALPPQADEDPYERHVLLTAMKKIARRLTGVQLADIPSDVMTAEPPEIPPAEPSAISLTIITADLPQFYEPLLLTFYRDPQREGDWIVIGNDWGTELRVDAAGAVYSFDFLSEKASRFVNSSVRQLASFIEAHQDFVVQPCRSNADMQSAVNSFRELLDALDRKALSSAENWWALVVERMLA